MSYASLFATLSNICIPGFVHYRCLVHEGNVVTVEGGIMHEPDNVVMVTTVWDCHQVS